MQIKTIAKALNQLDHPVQQGFQFDVQLIPGEVEVLQVCLNGREEIPLFVSSTDEQVLCIAYLFSEQEVKAETRHSMQEAMLDMNIPMPLSSFSRIDDQYVVFGALSVNSSIEDIAHEIIILSDNALDAIDALSDYLN